MSKRNSPPRELGEGPSRKRSRETEPERVRRLRAQHEALERVLGSRGRPSRPAEAEQAVPASEIARLREENERAQNELAATREALAGNERELAALREELERTRNELEAERQERQNLAEELRQRELQGQAAEPPAEVDEPLEEEEEAAVMDEAEADEAPQQQPIPVVRVHAQVQADLIPNLPPLRPARQRRAAAIVAANAIRAMGVALSRRARQDIENELDSLYEELADGDNHPRISRALFSRVTSQFLGRSDHPEFNISRHPVYNLESRNTVRRTFRLARMLASMCGRKTVVNNDFVNAKAILNDLQ